jgi:hypothetical protein
MDEADRQIGDSAGARGSVSASHHSSDNHRAVFRRPVKAGHHALIRLDNGIGLYRYRYKWDHQPFVGVMAQEVADVVPTAVMRGHDGYLRVDYGQLGLSLMTWDEWVAREGERPRHGPNQRLRG